MRQRASKRERRKPELFGTFGAAEQAEELEPEQRLADSEEEEQEDERPRKRARRQRRRTADSEGDEEEQGEPAAAAQRGGSRGAKRAARQPRKQQQREAAGLPAPAAPLSRSDFLGALHACPALMDMILQADGLRTPTLLARDAANLAVALCASSEQMDCAWRTLAARAAGTEGFVGTSTEALAAAQVAVKGDPARSQRCTTTTARQDYRLSDKDLGGLEYVARDNPIFWSAAPTRLYRVLDCLATAHRKYGDLAGIQAAKAKAAERGQKVKATRQGNTQRRKQEMDEAMKAEGLNGWRYRKHADVTGYVKHGRGSAAEVAASLKKGEEAEARTAERQVQLVQLLGKEGLGAVGWRLLPAATRFIAGEGDETLESVVVAVRKEKEVAEGRVQRTAALKQRLEQEGLLSSKARVYYSDEEYMQFSVPGARNFIASGEGSISSIVEAVRKAREKEAQQERAAEQRRQEVDERRGQASAALEAAGIDWSGHGFYEVPALHAFVHQGEGSKEELAAAVQAHLAQEREHRERRAHARALLDGEGLGYVLDGYYTIPAIDGYIMTGEGNDESILVAARAAHEQREQRMQEREQRLQEELVWQQAMSERNARVVQLLRDNGMPSFYAFSVASIAYYIETGEGSDVAALADAKRHHSAKPHAQLLAERMEHAGAGGADAGAAAAGGAGAAGGDGGAAAAAAAAGAAGPIVW